jgi:hypothetical protein
MHDKPVAETQNRVDVRKASENNAAARLEQRGRDLLARAKEAEQQAAQLANPKARSGWLKIADSYRQLASRVPELIRSQRYHDQAASLRDMAAKEESPRTKEKLLAIAEEYESLCTEVVDRRLRKSP